MKLKQLLNVASTDQPQLGKLLSPSWSSGLSAVVITLVLVIGTVAAVHYRGSDIELLRNDQAVQAQTVADNYDTLNNNLSGNQIVSDIPLLILWGGVGLISYYFLMSVLGSAKRAVDFEHQLDYVHANRQQLIMGAIVKAVIKAGVLAIWFLYLKFTQHVLLPYVIALSYAGSGNLYGGWPQNLGYLILAEAVALLTLHLHVIFLRLAFLRTRLFGGV